MKKKPRTMKMIVAAMLVHSLVLDKAVPRLSPILALANTNVGIGYIPPLKNPEEIIEMSFFHCNKNQRTKKDSKKQDFIYKVAVFLIFCADSIKYKKVGSLQYRFQCLQFNLSNSKICLKQKIFYLNSSVHCFKKKKDLKDKKKLTGKGESMNRSGDLDGV